MAEPALTRDDAQTDALIAKYRGLVCQIAGGFQRKLPRNVMRDDLIAAGMCGLWDAIRKHGSEPGEAFDWYVRVRIRGAILDELRAQDWLPRRVRSAATEERPAAVIVRIDDIGSAEVEHTLPSPDPDPETRALESEWAELWSLPLPEREAKIIHLHYRRGWRFKDIGELMGVSEPRISQLHARAINRLRAHLDDIEHREAKGRDIDAARIDRAIRNAESGAGSAPPHAGGVPRGGLGAQTAERPHRASEAGVRTAEPRHSQDSDCYRAPQRGAARPESGARAVPPGAFDESEPEPEWRVDVDWWRSDRGGVAMSATARALVPAASTLPEEGLDLRVELARYEAFLIDQAMIRSSGNAAEAAQLLGLTYSSFRKRVVRGRDRLRAVAAASPLTPAEPEPAPESAPEVPPPPAEPAEPDPPTQPGCAIGSEPPSGVYTTTVTRAQVAELKAEGLRETEIANRLGAHRFTVQRLLDPIGPAKVRVRDAIRSNPRH